MTTLEAEHLAVIKIYLFAVFCAILNLTGIAFGLLAMEAMHIMHWIFKILQSGANVGTFGTFLLAFYKHLYPRQSIREHAKFWMFNFKNKFKRKNKKK